ncbi:hypothetical protein [Pseudogulbenkiania sp. MAI-1]|uniref:hypothetical protein n=1 Tax=Pseudogulbenkiania sp. MAI-1 TaxID=990370 RepID=UPI00045E7F9B|nr:hypothetical protein [Pseudogulbenkiania sp. MAI-1]
METVLFQPEIKLTPDLKAIRAWVPEGAIVLVELQATSEGIVRSRLDIDKVMFIDHIPEKITEEIIQKLIDTLISKLKNTNAS